MLVNLCERAASNPLLSQVLADSRLGPVLTLKEDNPDLRLSADKEPKYFVKKIVRAANAPGRNKRKVLVK